MAFNPNGSWTMKQARQPPKSEGYVPKYNAEPVNKGERDPRRPTDSL